MIHRLTSGVFFFLISCGVFLAVQNTCAQRYEPEWSVAQNFYEKGILYFDFDGDGKQELTKFLFNSVVVYSGVNEFAVVWSVIDDNHDELLLWDKYDTGGDSEIVLFVASDIYENASSGLAAYEAAGEEPLWTTQDYDGYYSFISCDNLDDDEDKEIAMGLNEWDADNEVYNSRFVIFDCQSGEEEFASGEFAGYMAGPYIGDIDVDDSMEIMFNLYNYADSTSTLTVYSFRPENGYVADGGVPQNLRFGQNYPNPFNASTVIPIRLERPSQLQIKVFDVHGRMINTVIEGEITAGSHRFVWNGRTGGGARAPSGMYFYEVRIGDRAYKKPMVLSK